jgi:hypothetical protein
MSARLAGDRCPGSYRCRGCPRRLPAGRVPCLPRPDGAGELEGPGRGPADARVDARFDARFDARGEAHVDVVPGVAVDVVGVRDRLGAVCVGDDDRVGVTTEGAGIQDDEAPPAVGVAGAGVFVGGVTGQVAALVLV